MSLEHFWDGFFKYAAIQGVFKGVAKAGKDLVKVPAKPVANAASGAMKTNVIREGMEHAPIPAPVKPTGLAPAKIAPVEPKPNVLQYGKDGVKFTQGNQPPSQAWKEKLKSKQSKEKSIYQMREAQRSQSRIQNAVKNGIPHSEWTKALGTNA